MRFLLVFVFSQIEVPDWAWVRNFYIFKKGWAKLASNVNNNLSYFICIFSTFYLFPHDIILLYVNRKYVLWLDSTLRKLETEVPPPDYRHWIVSMSSFWKNVQQFRSLVDNVFFLTLFRCWMIEKNGWILICWGKMVRSWHCGFNIFVSLIYIILYIYYLTRWL